MGMPSRPRTVQQIIAFIAAVVIGTTLVIFVVHWITDSWAVSSAAGVIAGVLSVAMYPILFRKRSDGAR